MKPSARALSFWIGLFLFSIYLLSFSGKLHVMDEFVGFAVGNNLIQHGRPDVNQFIWTNHWHTTPPGLWGKDGNLYTKKAPGISLAAAPLIWLGHTLPGLNAVHLGLLTSAVVTAATGSLLFIWLVELKISRAVAGFIALSYGLGTIAWVYARFLWEHSIMAFVFLAAVWAVRKAVRQRDSIWVLVCGGALAVSLTMRFEAAMAVALFGLYLFFCASSWPQPVLSVKNFVRAVQNKTRWQWLTIYATLPVLAVLGLLYFNFVRFGSLSETGYNREILFQRPWEGAFGLLLSPSTGLFIYMPLLLLIFWGVRPAWRHLSRPYFWLIVTLCLFYWLFYGSWFSWGSTWVWGPRFMLHTLPLLLLFVAKALERLYSSQQPARILGWLGVGLLAVAGFFINLLGVVVDLNEHFLRLGRNDNFVFNWLAFPPLGHWRILQEGLVDIIWLRPQPNGWLVEWGVLAPALALLVLSTVGLIFAYRTSEKAEKSAPHLISHFARHPLSLIVMTILSIALVYQMMLGTAQVALADEQAQADRLVLDRLAASAQPHDALLIPMFPFGDVQEISTFLMAYLDKPLPTYAWIESEPRAIQPDEREQLWQTVQNEAERVWLFERWLSQKDSLSLTAARFNQKAFPVQEQWFEQSGKLTLYALPPHDRSAISTPLNVSFEGGLTLVDFAVFNPAVSPGEILKVRLRWHVPELNQMVGAGLPEGRIVGFVHLLDEGSGQNVAQNDRVLLDLQNIKQSPLLPGQTDWQGYGLRLPNNLAPGSYSLITGLYFTTTGQRLPRADDSPDDFLYLTNITVQ